MYQDEINIKGSEVSYSRADADNTAANTTKKMDVNQIVSLIQQGASLVTMVPKKTKTEIDSAIKASCGARPLFKGSKRDKWEKCAAATVQRMQAANAPAQTVIVREPFVAKPQKTNLTPLWIGLGVAAVGLTVFLVIRKMKSGAKAPITA